MTHLFLLFEVTAGCRNRMWDSGLLTLLVGAPGNVPMVMSRLMQVVDLLLLVEAPTGTLLQVGIVSMEMSFLLLRVGFVAPSLCALVRTAPGFGLQVCSGLPAAFR